MRDTVTIESVLWNRRDGRFLALIVLLAFALRVFFWFDQGRAGVVFSGDADEYYRGAVHLFLDGSYYDEGQWLRPPLTSLFWALCFALFGPHLPTTMLAQCGLSAITVLLIGDTARRLFLSRRTGLLAALLAALFLPFAVMASQALSETVFIFTIALSLWLLQIAGSRGMRPLGLVLLAGAAFGTAALARPVGLYALPLLVLWAALAPNLTQPSENRHRLRLLPAAFLLAGFVLVVAPWTIRNYLIYDQLVLVDTNGGVSFWFGTIKDPAEQKMQDVWKATLPNSALRQQAALRLGLENIRSDPWRWIGRMRNKVVSLWQLETRLFAGNAATGVTLEEGSLAYALLADSQYVLVVLLALIALVLGRSSERSWLLIGWPLYGTLLSALSLGHPRLRLPLLVPLLIYAALPLAHPRSMAQRWLAAAIVWRLLLVGTCLGFLLLLYASAYKPFAEGQFWLLWARLGGNKQVALERAAQADPEGFLPQLALADDALAQGDPAAALKFYQQAGEYAPRSVYAHAQQIPLRLSQGDTAGAAAALQAIADVDWDNNLFYQWAWRKLRVPPPARLEMDGAADIGSIQGFYRATTEQTTTLRWAMDQLLLRFASAGTQSTLRLRLRAAAPETVVEVRVAGQAAPLATVLVGTAWQMLEVPLPALDTGSVIIELCAPAPILSTREPYARSVAIDWAEVVSTRRNK